MAITSEENEKNVAELIRLTAIKKETDKQVKLLREKIKEYAELEQLNETSWGRDGSYVELETVPQYKLVELPVKAELAEDGVMSENTFEEAIKVKCSLSRKGHKLFKQGDEQLAKLMDKTLKKKLKVILKGQEE